ncbi:MAG: NADPH-dependent 7-cyano-7-deazaguanine reductase QueF [Pseudomonadota bacterium]
MTLLGKSSPSPAEYAPEILYPIPRRIARDSLGLTSLGLTSPGQTEPVPFYGDDLWHAWELTWLDAQGLPQHGVGRFRFAATTDNLVESKSFKLYLNSLYNARFASSAALEERLVSDLSALAQGEVVAEVLQLEDESLRPATLPGRCVDNVMLEVVPPEPSAEILQLAAEPSNGALYSHGLRSLCPVTSQPDWATVVLTTTGPTVTDASLRAYVLSYREHQEYHEQCVERMFRDLLAIGVTDFSVHALYTRRGGLDISPWRSTSPGVGPVLRTLRQ